MFYFKFPRNAHIFTQKLVFLRERRRKGGKRVRKRGKRVRKGGKRVGKKKEKGTERKKGG